MEDYTWWNALWELIWMILSLAVGSAITNQIVAHQIRIRDKALEKADQTIVKLLQQLGHSDACMPDRTHDFD